MQFRFILYSNKLIYFEDEANSLDKEPCGSIFFGNWFHLKLKEEAIYICTQFEKLVLKNSRNGEEDFDEWLNKFKIIQKRTQNIKEEKNKRNSNKIMKHISKKNDTFRNPTHHFSTFERNEENEKPDELSERYLSKIFQFDFALDFILMKNVKLIACGSNHFLFYTELDQLW